MNEALLAALGLICIVLFVCGLFAYYRRPLTKEEVAIGYEAANPREGE